MDPDAKQELRTYLQQGRDAVLWKLDGLDERDRRRPLTPTGTNLLGLVKHLAGVEAGYFGDVFGRAFPEPLDFMADDAPDNADMWATAAETSEQLEALYRRVWVHSDTTIDALPLDATGRVPWWSTAGPVTLHRILIHVATETHRHAGHADVVRELIDERVGHRDGVSNLPDHDRQWWSDYRARLQAVADAPR